MLARANRTTSVWKITVHARNKTRVRGALVLGKVLHKSYEKRNETKRTDALSLNLTNYDRFIQNKNKKKSVIFCAYMSRYKALRKRTQYSKFTQTKRARL